MLKIRNNLYGNIPLLQHYWMWCRIIRCSELLDYYIKCTCSGREAHGRWNDKERARCWAKLWGKEHMSPQFGDRSHGRWGTSQEKATFIHPGSFGWCFCKETRGESWELNNHVGERWRGGGIFVFHKNSSIGIESLICAFFICLLLSLHPHLH